MYFTLALDIKGINIVFFKPKLNIKNILLILLMVVFLIVVDANSAPPSLPPALPKEENTKIINKESKHKSSFFDKIFRSERSDNNESEKPIQQVIPEVDKENSNNTENVDDFINLGDKKLPVLENSGLDTKDITTPEQGNIKQQNDSINTLIPSLPPQVQDDRNLYTSPVKNNDTPASSTLENEVGNRGNNIEPFVQALPPVLPPAKVEVPQMDSKAANGEVTPVTNTTPPSQLVPVEVPVLPPISIPEPEVIKPLSDKKDSNAKIQPSLPSDKVTPSISTTGSKDNIKTDVEQNNSSPGKLLLDKVKIPVPVFVGDNKPAIEAKEEQEKNKRKLPEPTVVTTTRAPIVEKNIPKQEMSEELVQFINNETQMLLLPNDDIVLGKLIDDARIEQMDMYSFVTEFKKIYDRDKRKNQRQQIDNFINNYSNNFRTLYIMPCNVMNMAFNTIIKNDLSSLRGLLDNYPILQRKGERNNTLLHIAAEQNNYYIAKFLIIRGININPINDDCKTSLDIAQEECNGNIACLKKKERI
ncbi:MAG: ankyrin repeat domain-containing protein [Rickettsia endosymbiont of Bryobia graminum]|nr:ankyrin repeat domain-containing protein [Rickettsia endosymbiont of Bryobia graminum]